MSAQGWNTRAMAVVSLSESTIQATTKIDAAIAGGRSKARRIAGHVDHPQRIEIADSRSVASSISRWRKAGESSRCLVASAARSTQLINRLWICGMWSSILRAMLRDPNRRKAGPSTPITNAQPAGIDDQRHGDPAERGPEGEYQVDQ